MCGIPHSAGRPRVWRAALAIVVALAAMLALLRVADGLAERWALAGVRSAAAAAVPLRVAVVDSEIAKQRVIPIVLAQDPDVRAVLALREPDRIARLDAKLEALSAGTRAAVIYLLDATGMTIAASNWREPTSFVGARYGFRPYYRRAMSDGVAEHFALGTRSGRPGLYLARRLDGEAGALGVIVVKAELEPIAASWQALAEPTFITDENGVVVVASVPEWRFRTVAPLAAERRAEIRATQEFGDAPLDPLPVARGGDAGGELGLVRAQLPGARLAATFVEVVAPVPTTGWTLHVLAPTRAAVGLATTTARALVAVVGVVALAGTGLWLSRRRRVAGERAQQEGIRRELEARVGERTAELEDANRQLVAEADERRRAEAALHSLQDELVQASKLALLGQVAASVAHEINQPVAAIRTFAESSQLLLARGDPAKAAGNQATIVSLTERIGTITDGLRAFARKAPKRIEPVSLRTVIDGALLLVGHRLRQQAIDLDVDVGAGDIVVAAERIRLEQVLVNLLQNAVEALSGRADGRIRIAAATEPEQVTITVADNGPGLAPEVLRSLFMPFRSTKPSGLGLGLVISSDIVAELHGTLAAENRDGGAAFTITLPRPT